MLLEQETSGNLETYKTRMYMQRQTFGCLFVGVKPHHDFVPHHRL